MGGSEQANVQEALLERAAHFIPEAEVSINRIAQVATRAVRFCEQLEKQLERFSKTKKKELDAEKARQALDLIADEQERAEEESRRILSASSGNLPEAEAQISDAEAAAFRVASPKAAAAKVPTSPSSSRGRMALADQAERDKVGAAKSAAAAALEEMFGNDVFSLMKSSVTNARDSAGHVRKRASAVKQKMDFIKAQVNVKAENWQKEFADMIEVLTPAILCNELNNHLKVHLYTHLGEHMARRKWNDAEPPPTADMAIPDPSSSAGTSFGLGSHHISRSQFPAVKKSVAHVPQPQPVQFGWNNLAAPACDIDDEEPADLKLAALRRFEFLMEANGTLSQPASVGQKASPNLLASSDVLPKDYSYLSEVSKGTSQSQEAAHGRGISDIEDEYSMC